MIVDSPPAFHAAVSELESRGQWPRQPASASAVFMVSPADFQVSAATSADNVYLDLEGEADSQRASRQHQALVEAIRAAGIEVTLFAGESETPDGIFPNNVFATAPGRFLVGHMKVAERRREAQREDIRQHFLQAGRRLWDLSEQPGVCELTGPLIIDHARNIGFCGISQRVDPLGLTAMHHAFGLDLTFRFDLVPWEYHTNVVMSVLAGRALVIAPEAFMDPAVPEAIATLYGERCLTLTDAQKQAFAGNCLCLGDAHLFLSRQGLDALTGAQKQDLQDWGFQLHAVEVDELEKAGGSVRCMIGEIF